MNRLDQCIENLVELIDKYSKNNLEEYKKVNEYLYKNEFIDDQHITIRLNNFDGVYLVSEIGFDKISKSNNVYITINRNTDYEYTSYNLKYDLYNVKNHTEYIIECVDILYSKMIQYIIKDEG